MIVPGLLVVVSLLSAVPLPEARRTFEETNRRFTEAASAEEFLAVAAAYQSILDGGVHSGVVLFNQGNAYFRAGAYGRAIAAYRQAERYRPRDPLLASNLDLARSKLGVAAPPRRLVDHVLFWRRWLSVTETASLLIGLSLLALACGVLGLFLGRGSRVLARAAVGGAVLFGLAHAADRWEFDRTEHGVVVADEAVARMGNAESFAPAFTEPLRAGREFTVLERAGGWVRVELDGGLDGWLAAEDVVTY
ncbi:MAG: hypothetical protein ACF8XB_02315 [Planctomycetota bacterium JB042]